jgi:hypothetical protein
MLTEQGRFIRGQMPMRETSMEARSVPARKSARASIAQVNGTADDRWCLSPRRAAIKIADPTSQHPVSDVDMLARVVHAIDPNDARLDDYLTWIALLIAIKAASGGSRQSYDEVVWHWLQTSPINVLPDRSGVDRDIRMLDKWNSIRDAQNGAEFV